MSLDQTYIIRLRRGTTTQWSLVNPILSAGEPGYATDVNLYKIGDGASTWEELPWTTGLPGADGPPGPEGPQGPPGPVEEAPVDGFEYARKDASWVLSSSANGILDAPADGIAYARQDNIWINIDERYKSVADANLDHQDLQAAIDALTLSSDAVISIATDDTPTAIGAAADFTAPGSDAHTVIQQAIDSIGEGGELVFLPGTYDISQTIKVVNERVSLRFIPGAVIRWLGVTGRTPLLHILASNVYVWQPELDGSGAKGNGIGIQVGGQASTEPIVGGDQPGGVHIFWPRASDLDTGVEFGVESDGSQSSGDNTLWGGRIRRCKVGLRNAGFVNYANNPVISECDYGIQQTADRYSGRIVVRGATLNQHAIAAVSLLRGRGSTFYDLWMEHTVTQDKVPTESIQIVPEGSDEVINTSFNGTTHIHPIDALDGTPELYGIRLSGSVKGLHMEHVEMTNELPSNAIIRLDATYDGAGAFVDRVSFGNDIPPAYTHDNLLSRDPAASGIFAVRDAPVPGSIAGTTVGAETPEPSGFTSYNVGVKGDPNSATYWAKGYGGHVVSIHSDTADTSGLKAVIEDILSDASPNGLKVHFGSGRYHFLDAPTGNESWAGVEDHVSWGGSSLLTQGLEISGEGIDNTIISNRTNWQGAADTEPFSFTNATDVHIRDLTVESCGYYKSTTDALDFDQGSRILVDNVKISRSRSRAIVVDGGDDGRNATHNVIRSVVVQGRPPETLCVAYAGGSLSTTTTYDYCLTWEDMDLAGAGVPAETRPSEPARLTTTGTNKQVRIQIPRAPYSVTKTHIYRRDATGGGWVLIGSVDGNQPTTFIDDGTAVTAPAVFTKRSTIPQGAIEFLGCSESIMTDNLIDGSGDGEIGAVQYGLNVVRKSSVPTSSDRNILQRNVVRGTMNAGIRVSGGSDNLISDNMVVNVGVPTAKVNGVRIEGLSGVLTNRNRVVNNTILDNRDSTHPDGGVGMNIGLTITSTNSPTSNIVQGNIFNGGATSNAISNSGVNSVIRQNSGTNSKTFDSSNIVVLAVGEAVPTGTPSGTLIARYVP